MVREARSEPAPGSLQSCVQNGRQVLPFLLLVRADQERRGQQGHAPVVHAGSPVVSHHVVEDELLPERRFLTAVLARPGPGQPVALGQLERRLPVELPALVDAEQGLHRRSPLRRGVLHLRAEELVELSLQGLLFRAVVKIHACVPTLLPSSRSLPGISRVLRSSVRSRPRSIFRRYRWTPRSARAGMPPASRP